MKNNTSTLGNKYNINISDMVQDMHKMFSHIILTFDCMSFFFFFYGNPSS